MDDDAPVNRSDATGVRMAELVATLSLVADLGMGRPMERDRGSCRRHRLGGMPGRPGLMARFAAAGCFSY
jgi:hypothetical protein